MYFRTLRSIFLGLRTVDEVLASFRRNIEDLRALAESKLDEIDALDAEIVEATFLRNQARVESSRADAVAAKLQALIS